MAYIYADLIRRGVINKKTGMPYKLEDVPEVWRGIRLREEVAKLLEE